MKIETIRFQNYKTFKDTEIKNIPRLCIFVGANGVGKSTIFSMFAFLKEAFTTNVKIALSKMGGWEEVRTRNSEGPISLEIQFRENKIKPLVTYTLKINQNDRGEIYIEDESIRYRKGSFGSVWTFMEFKNGLGRVATNELDVSSANELKYDKQSLKSKDILAIKGLSQFKNYPIIETLGNIFENWHLSDFHINEARRTPEVEYAEHLSREGENLPNVIDYLHKNHSGILEEIITRLQRRIPGIQSVRTRETEEGRVLLKFQDESFDRPFLSRHVSDGTIKMLAYLVLLLDPNPRPLLCIEEPENQLYLKLLYELAEEFRSYAQKGGQVFVSTHSADLLNAAQIDEVFWLEKKNGETIIKRAEDDEQIKKYMGEGDQMGYLWKEGFFGEIDP